MTLTSGTKLGSYEIQSSLGAGGMGEVYRARDTKLNRDVAIKVLPGSVAHDRDRMARFAREAQILASLSHPNIAAVYGLEETSESPALVMELVQGPTLAERLHSGPLSPEDAMAIAQQIVNALEFAHERGVTHRDLKPANIKLTLEGDVKVLDFGLAKVFQVEGTRSDHPSSSPTLTSLATQAGMIVGTAAYMSPEQAKGKPVDKRADVWAFGCVFYEMLSGKQVFHGETATDTLAAVIRADPDWTVLPANTSSQIRDLLIRCLQKDPKRRLRDIGDARFLLEDAPFEPPAPVVGTRKLPWVLAAVLTIALALALVVLWPAPVDRPLMRLDVDLGRGAASNALVIAAISSDGMRLVFHAHGPDGRDLLATRRLDESKVTALTGTEDADQPFFSPDGRWIAFFADNKLKKISVQGGTPIILCDAGIPRGASWGDDGNIIAALSNSSGLSRIPADGGQPQTVTSLSRGEPTHRWPQVLPGSKAVLFTANPPTLNSYEDATIDVQSLKTGERKTLWRGGYFGRYVPSGKSHGHLVFVRNGILFAVPFDPDRLEIKGVPYPLLEDVAADPGNAAGHFDFSRTGIFVYQSGNGVRRWTVAWLDSSGKTQPLLPKPGLYYSPRFAPDGQRLAIGVDSGTGADIFIYDYQHDTMSRLTFTARMNSDPVWTPDAKHLVFRNLSANGAALWWVRTDGAGEPQRLLDVNAADLGPNSFSPDGRVLIYTGETGEISALPLDLSNPDHPKPGKPEVFFHSHFNETRPAFSPDGHWVAYQSNESGRDEVYVRPYPGSASSPSEKWQISAGGGGSPVWSQRGRELFFTSGGQIMVTQYAVRDGSFLARGPRPWSPTRILGNTGFSNQDLAPDGKRFAIFPQPEPVAADETPRVTLLLNFFGELRRRSPND